MLQEIKNNFTLCLDCLKQKKMASVTLGRSRRTTAKVDYTYKNQIDSEDDSEDEQEKFLQIIGYDSGSDFEEDLKGHGKESDGDTSEEEDHFDDM